MTRRRVKVPMKGAHSAAALGPGVRVLDVSPEGEAELDDNGVEGLEAPLSVEATSGTGPKGVWGGSFERCARSVIWGT